jgi:hypothetical protein
VSGSRQHLLLRTPVQITIWLLLLIVTLGPHHSLFVCATGCCRAAAAQAEAGGCSCCQKTSCCAATHDGGGSTAKNGARRCHNCCIDVATLTELGPMPRTVDCPDLAPPCIGEVPYAADDGFDHGVDAPRPRCTGPPRPGLTTDLLATTTILRQ